MEKLCGQPPPDVRGFLDGTQDALAPADHIFLGWQSTKGIDGATRDFYVRQLYDWKGITVAEKMIPDGMPQFGQLCGHTLARAHARSGDPIAIGEYPGSGDVFDQALGRFAEACADQNERDHAALVKAVRERRVEAKTVI